MKCLHCLQKKLEEALDKQGVDVSEDLHGDLDSIMQQHSPNIASKFPANSFQRIFWDQQQQANAAKKAQGRRWHPLTIKWCLYLHHVSSRGYEVLRNSGVISLPSQRTLRDYTHFLESVPGFSADVDQMLMEVSKVSSCQVSVIIEVSPFLNIGVYVGVSKVCLLGYGRDAHKRRFDLQQAYWGTCWICELMGHQLSSTEVRTVTL